MADLATWPPTATQTVTTETTVPDWVDQAAQQNLATAKQYASLPYVAYGGTLLAGFSPEQLAAFDAVRKMQGNAPAQIAQATADAINLPDTIGSLYSPMTAGVESNSFANIMRMLATTRQAIRINAAQQGTLGGTREAIDLGMAGSDAQRALGSSIGNIAGGAWMDATRQALGSIAARGDLATAGQSATIADTQALAAIGGEQQTQQQTTYAQALQQWQQQQNYPYQQMAILQSVLAGTPYGATTTSSQPYNTNRTSSALGAAASLIPAIGAIPGALSSLGAAGSALGMGSGLLTAMSGVAPMFAPIGIGATVGGLVGGSTGSVIGGGVGALGALALLLLL